LRVYIFSTDIVHHNMADPCIIKSGVFHYCGYLQYQLHFLCYVCSWVQTCAWNTSYPEILIPWFQMVLII